MFDSAVLPNFLVGVCPDDKCQAQIYFTTNQHSAVECIECGQSHQPGAVKNVKEVTDLVSHLPDVLRSLLINSCRTKKGPEMVKVLGISNYHCRLISPLLTKYGLNKKTGEIALLSTFTQSEYFDCSSLSDRAFVIELQHIDVPGYGRDMTGSETYLSGTLEVIKSFNNGEERLIPIHAEGDGHCLVHAISRAIVGRELFWHALRCKLQGHIRENLNHYMDLFQDFVGASEWEDIINECDPNFEPARGEQMGLRNIHVFGLANILKRPIILLDSIEGMKSSGDYSAVFLPGLLSPDQCRGKTGELNKPLCLAWSNKGRGHFIPLVGIRCAELPRIHRSFLPKVWGIRQNLISAYIDFVNGQWCIVGGNRCLPDSYVSKLVDLIDKEFYKVHGVHPALVADMSQHISKRTGMGNLAPHLCLKMLQTLLEERKLFRCQSCDAVFEERWPSSWFKPNGKLYVAAETANGKLVPDMTYRFTDQNSLLCKYDHDLDELVPSEAFRDKCMFCMATMYREVRPDNTIVYINRDKTRTKSSSTKCPCGYKHWWNGQEYDNLPNNIQVSFTFQGQQYNETVEWFQNETDESLNSNAYDEATKIVLHRLPGVFGSEHVVRSIVDQILSQTKTNTVVQECIAPQNPEPKEPPPKIILPGMKLLHKEELGVSEVEKNIKERVKKHAAEEQNRSAEERKRRHVESPVPEHVVGTHVPSVNEAVAEQKVEPKKKPKGKVVRMVTSEGQQCQITLPESTCYRDLLEQITTVGGISHEQVRKITYGFPRKEIKPPTDGDDDFLVPLQSGDRIQVELYKPEERHNLEIIEEPTIDNSVALHNIISTMILNILSVGHDAWEYVRDIPSLFTVNGMFYSEMSRNVGVRHNQHFKLRGLADRLFRYNSTSDQIELCVGDHIHLDIGPGIEDRIKLATAHPKSRVKSGITSSRPSKKPEQIFRGPGYVLCARPKEDDEEEDKSDVELKSEKDE